MTASRFDPRSLTLYDTAPPLLHLEFGHQGRVYRYVRATEFAPGALDPDTRRTAAEVAARLSHEDIRREALKGA